MIDPGMEAHIRDTAGQKLVADYYGFRLTELGVGTAAMEAGWEERRSHRPGLFQGTIISALAEFAGNFAAMSTLPADRRTTTIDQTIKFLTPPRGERLVARARILRPGRRIISCAIEIFVEEKGSETLCAAMLQSNNVFALDSAPAESKEGR